MSYAEQADRLLERGLVADKDELIDVLSNVGYYRLSAYIYPFKQLDSECLLPGTSLDKIVRRYRFDRRFRCLILDALERVEVSLKAKVVNSFSQKYGPFGYLDIGNYTGFSGKDFDKLKETIDSEIERHRRTKERFVVHYFEKYDESRLPFWMAAELLTFGNVLTIYRRSSKELRMEIAKAYGLPDKIMDSWLLTLNHVRNICAHHARLWNRRLGIRPLIPIAKKHPEWARVNNDKPFCILLMLSRLLSCCARHSGWRDRVEALTDEYRDLPLRCMGFPDDWKRNPLWRMDAGRRVSAASGELK